MTTVLILAIAAAFGSTALYLGQQAVRVHRDGDHVHSFIGTALALVLAAAAVFFVAILVRAP